MAPAPLTTATPPVDPVARYESAVAELETLVARLERGDAPLDEALGLFERGMALVAQCRGALDHAELRVKNLLDTDTPDADEGEADEEGDADDEDASLADRR